MSALFASRAAAILALLEQAHHAHGIGTDVPHDAWAVRAMQAIADRVGTGIEQSLPAAVAVILDSVTAAAVILRPVIDVTEPRAIFERQPSDPFVL